MFLASTERAVGTEETVQNLPAEKVKESGNFVLLSQPRLRHNVHLSWYGHTAQMLTDARSDMADATNKMDDLIRMHPWMEPSRIESELRKVVRENTSAKLKRKKVIAIANRTVDALAPYVACKPGCSHCCYMNTMIYEHEAVRLAEVTGRKMKRLPHRPLALVYLAGDRFNGKPCTFLVNNECSVYDDRPLVCRVHHSLHDDASLCDMSIPASEAVRPPMYDPDLVEIPYSEINAAHNAREPWGNIAEFFPDEG